MAGAFRGLTQGFKFWDSAGNNTVLGQYSIVSMASAAEVSAANAAGHNGNVGEIVVQTPVSSGLPTRPIVGVAHNSAKTGQDVMVVTHGVAWVMVNAAVAAGAVLFAAATTTRTNSQTPLTNNYEMLIPADPTLGVTYAMTLADDTALPASGTIHYPLGYALTAAANQYDIIPVHLLGGMYGR